MKVYQKLTVFVVCLASLLSALSSWAVSPNLVIAEAYGGGGNAGSTWKNDFIVVFNRSASAVDVNGWSVQYNSATGTGAWQVTPLAGASTLIQPGAYFLVQEAQGAGGTLNLPAPDATGSIAMGAGGFKVALVNNTTALSGGNPSGPQIIDLVGASATATAFEGTGPAPAPSNTTSVQRGNGGCTDTDQNATDFTATAPNPRNSSSGLHSCGGALAPVISGIAPAAVTTNAGAIVNYTVSLSQGDSPVFYWYKQAGGTTNLIPSATTQTLTLSNVLKGVDEANYQVIVSNQVGMATSAVVSLTVTGDPGIRTQPASVVGLLDGTVQFSVVPAATSPSFQWYYADSSSNITAAVTDGPQPSGDYALGSTTSTLTLTNLQLASISNFVVVINNTYGSVTSIVASIQSVSTSGMLAYWDFNGSEFTNTPANIQSPAPYVGAGTAAAVGLCNNPGVSPFSGAVDPNDGFGGALNNHLPNFSWGTSSYPSNGVPAVVSNKTSGVQFKVSTLGAKDITVHYDSRVTGTATKYARLQYTTNGTTWIDYPASSLYPPPQVNKFVTFDYSLVGFPGTANNPNFGIRVVSEIESTASYGISSNTNYVGDANTYGTAGTVTFDQVTISGDAITNANTPPTISSSPDTNTVENVPLTLNFTVGDAESSASSLTLSAQSLNPVSVNPNFSFGGSGANRTVTITPNAIPDSFDATPILVTVTDPNGDSTATWFILTVQGVNLPPTNTLTSVGATNVLANSSLTMPFTVGDDRTALNGLSYSASSDNTTVVPTGNIVIGGTAPNKIVTITPAPNQVGIATVRVTVSDNDSSVPKSTTASVSLMVRPNTNVVFVDYFNYDNSGALDQVSSNFWKHLSGIFGQMQVGGGVVTVNTLDNTENMQTALLGAPYTTNSPAVLYASLIVNLADPTRLPRLNGTYVAVFNDGSGSTANIEGRLMVATNGAAPGYYRLGIANAGTVATNSQMFARDLAFGSNYVAVMKLVVSSGLATLWVSPSSQSSPSVTDPTPPDTLFSISDFELRESGANAGAVSISHLKIGTTFDSVFPSPQIQTIGGQTVVTWSDPTVTLQSASSVFGPFTDLTGVTSPYTNTSPTDVQFFRFKP